MNAGMNIKKRWGNLIERRGSPRGVLAVAAVAALVTSGAAQAQAVGSEWPTRPVTIVVGYAAGGGVDFMARLLAEKLSERLRQPVVVENRPSVGAVVGSAHVARAKPDGYTLMMGAPDRKSTRLNSSHVSESRMPSSA